jgi:hypothetical protein
MENTTTNIAQLFNSVARFFTTTPYYFLTSGATKKRKDTDNFVTVGS